MSLGLAMQTQPDNNMTWAPEPGHTRSGIVVVFSSSQILLRLLTLGTICFSPSWQRCHI